MEVVQKLKFSNNSIRGRGNFGADSGNYGIFEDIAQVNRAIFGKTPITNY
jgi:hypothetical protein